MVVGQAMEIGLTLIALAGHMMVMIFVINRVHSTAIPHRVMKSIDVVWYLVTLGIPALFIGDRWLGYPALPQEVSALGRMLLIYGCSAAIVGVVNWTLRKLYLRDTTRLTEDRVRMVDAVERLGYRPAGSPSAKLAHWIPGNEVFKIAVHEKQLALPRLPHALDRLTINHLSDLHFTGRVTKPFYELIVELSNETQSDLVIISGDIIDKVICFDWLSDVLGKLTAKHGVYFVLGNHDIRVHDEVRVRRTLTDHGLIDLGKRWTTVTVNDEPIVLAGNETPWFTPAADLSTVPVEQKDAFRIAVSHSPDQLQWARRHNVDLMLAGHTHGGQVRLPVIGPVFSPSLYGVKYCGGTFFKAPTLMHVSRGLSGTRPLRINCTPELARLTLRTSPE